MTTGRKCCRMWLNANRNRWACPGEAKRFITRSRTLVGWWEFSARLLRHVARRWVTDGKSARAAT